MLTILWVHVNKSKRYWEHTLTNQKLTQMWLLCLQKYEDVNESLRLERQKKNYGCGCIHDISESVGIVLQYLILVTLLIDGDNEFGNVRDELVALSLPQCLYTDLKVFNQDFLKSGRKGITDLCLTKIQIYTINKKDFRLGLELGIT